MDQASFQLRDSYVFASHILELKVSTIMPGFFSQHFEQNLLVLIWLNSVL